jgi:virulence-associated protein VagC
VVAPKVVPNVAVVMTTSILVTQKGDELIVEPNNRSATHGYVKRIAW